MRANYSSILRLMMTLSVVPFGAHSQIIIGDEGPRFYKQTV